MCVCVHIRRLYVSVCAFVSRERKERAAGSYKSMFLSGIVLNERG